MSAAMISPPPRRHPSRRGRPVAAALAGVLGAVLLTAAIVVSGARPVTAEGFGDRASVLDGFVPDYPGKTRCGAAFAPEGEEFTEALAREDGLFGRLGLVRVYHGEGPPEWVGSSADLADRPVQVSFKYPPEEVNTGRHDTDLLAWFRSIPTDHDVYWTYFHEPENDIEEGEFSAAEFRSAWNRIYRLAEHAGNPRLHATLTLMQWTLHPDSGRSWRDYYPGRSAVDVLAWDVYNSPSQVKRGEYTPAHDLLGEIVSISRGQRLPWAVSEFGSHMAEGDDGTRRAVWLHEVTTYATWHHARFVSYFDLNWASGDYRIRDEPGIAAWRRFCGTPHR